MPALRVQIAQVQPCGIGYYQRGQFDGLRLVFLYRLSASLFRHAILAQSAAACFDMSVVMKTLAAWVMIPACTMLLLYAGCGRPADDKCPASNPYPYDANGVPGSWCCETDDISSTGSHGNLRDLCSRAAMPCATPPCSRAPDAPPPTNRKNESRMRRHMSRFRLLDRGGEVW